MLSSPEVWLSPNNLKEGKSSSYKPLPLHHHGTRQDRIRGIFSGVCYCGPEPDKNAVYIQEMMLLICYLSKI